MIHDDSIAPRLPRRAVLAGLLGSGLAGAAPPVPSRPMTPPEQAAARAAVAGARWQGPQRRGSGWLEWRLPGSLGLDPARCFEPESVDLRCQFSGPQGRRLRVTAFWSVDAAGAASGHWTLRLLPPLPGRWRAEPQLAIGAEPAIAAGAPFEFDVAAVPARQRVVVDARHSGYFAFDDGTPFVPVGLNLGWAARGQVLADYQRWFERLAAAGGNFARLWMASWSFGIEWQDTGLGDYRQRLDRAAELDAVFELAEASGIRLMLCLLNHGAFSETTDAEWAHNPYNRRHGGPLAAPQDFVSDPQAIALFERRLRYIAARWSHSPALHSWEWWNEVNWTPIERAALRPWFERMGRVLDAHDPYRRLRSSSWSDRGDALAWRGPALDFVQQHDYTAHDPMQHYAEAARAWQAEGLAAKPRVPAELGLEVAYDPAQPRPFEADALHLHNGLWAPLFHGFASTALYWWWDRLVDRQDLWPAYRGVARWLQALHARGLHLGEHRSILAEVSVPRPGLGPARPPRGSGNVAQPHVLESGHGARALALAGPRSLLMWLRADGLDAETQRQAWRAATGGTDPGTPWAPGFPRIEGAQLVLPALDWPDGPVQASWFDSEHGEPAGTTTAAVQGGTLTLPCPGFARGLAAIVQPAPAQPVADAPADARLQAVLARLRAGQEVCVVAIGGSITTGYAAPVPRAGGWAAQVARWLAGQGRPGAVRFVNAAVSGTDSAVAVQRLPAHVLAEQPDLVLVEFGVNDGFGDPAVRASSYEGLLRQLLGATRPPAVLPVLLTLQGNTPREAVDLQRRLAAHYGLDAVDVGAALAQQASAGTLRWSALYDEPVHPNQAGHDAIATRVIAALQAAADAAQAQVPVARSPAPVPPAPAPAALPPPLHGIDHVHVRHWAGDALQPWRARGFVRGGPVHPEWAALPGGQAPGWTSTDDAAEASFLVWGRQIAVFHAESEHFRNLEAWVDDGPVVTLRGHVPERRGYLGWSHTVVGRDLEAGAHLLHLRMRRDEHAGSGRPASLLGVMAAGRLPRALREALPGDFAPQAAPNGHAAAQATPVGHATPPAAAVDPSAPAGWRLVTVDDPALRWIGRIDRRSEPGAALLAWSGSELRARFSGTRLALRLAPARGGIAHFTVEVDGQRHALALLGSGVQDWVLRRPLGPGEHSLRVIKRTEGSMAEARLLGLLVDAPAVLAPPPERPLRLVFYGDSITAGACNGDEGEDQYEDLFAHDGTRAYGCLAAEKLGADYHGIAVSGIGLTRSWHELLMPMVWNRLAPRTDAPALPPPARDERQREIVLVNLGQNDHGFPASRGEPFPPEFAAAYLDFVRRLRRHHAGAKIVLLIGGMSAWREQPAIPAAIEATLRQLRAEGDSRLWHYRFQAFAWAHPRIDVHALMADELLAFLQAEVLTREP